MKRIGVIMINAAVLSVTSLLIRTADTSFTVYLSNKIGAEGMGLFQLIMSVYILGKTLAMSGIRFTVTRMVAEDSATCGTCGVRQSVRVCTAYGLFFGALASIALFFGAETAAVSLLGDTRCTLSFKILALVLPLYSYTAVMGGYFTAIRRAPVTAAVQFAELAVEIGVIIKCFSASVGNDAGVSCAIISFGYLCGEAVAAVIFFIMYRAGIRGKTSMKQCPRAAKMFSIALPVAFSTYLTSGMRTVQNLLIPAGLKKSGASADTALAAYGRVLGMAMPPVLFPAVFLDIVADIIVPELAESCAAGMRRRENYIVTRVFSVGITVTICVTGIFLRFANEISCALYSSTEAAPYIALLAPLIPVLYMDSVVDSMLKGIGEQISTVRYNILESAISIILLLVLLPRLGIGGYFLSFYITRILNFVLSIKRLIKKTSLCIDKASIAKAFICIFMSLSAAGLLCKVFILPIWVTIASSALIYFTLLRMVGCITGEDAEWLKSVFKA